MLFLCCHETGSIHSGDNSTRYYFHIENAYMVPPARAFEIVKIVYTLHLTQIFREYLFSVIRI